MKKIRGLIPQEIKNIYHFLQALLAVTISGYPSKKLKVIGITGTDGKTTTVNLVYHIIKSAGIKVSMVSTVNAFVGEATFDTGFHVTTPSPFGIQRFLKMMVKAGSEVAVLEVTSHGLDQNRVAFVDFYESIITNITHEHLDYHRNYESYLKAKAKILDGVKHRILNRDDKSFKRLSELGSGKMISFGIDNDADIIATDIKSNRKGLEFTIEFKNQVKFSGGLKVMSTLSGKFNVYNILAAVTAVKTLGIDNKSIEKALKQFNGVEGRLEVIDEGQKFDVVVDFAHTPNALKSVLTMLRDNSNKKLIAVFGSAGERDTGKRPIMGEVAAKLCDYVIITGEDPRGESVKKISSEIVLGLEKAGGIKNKTFWVIPDRVEAIRRAIIDLAQVGDTVVLLGKGHEKSINIGGKEYPWSDQLTARSALAERKK